MPNISLKKMFFVCLVFFFTKNRRQKWKKKLTFQWTWNQRMYFSLLCPFAGTLTSQINKNNAKSTLFFFRLDIIACMLYFFNINMLNYGFLRSSVFRPSCFYGFFYHCCFSTVYFNHYRGLPFPTEDTLVILRFLFLYQLSFCFQRNTLLLF